MTAETRAELPIKRFATGAKWRAWLDRHHAKSAGVWLEFPRKSAGAVSFTHADALEAALCYGWIDGQNRGAGPEWWQQRFTPRGPRSKWSQINCASALALIAAGTMAPAGLREVEAAKADGRWAAAYAGQRAMTVPPDLAAALARLPKARRFFERLDSKNRYAVLYRLHDAKRPETRARRLAKFVAMLEAGETLHPRS